MNRLDLLRKLRALADDPAAAPNERAVAAAKADALEAKAPEPPDLNLYPWQQQVLRNFGFWDQEFTPEEWNGLGDPVATSRGWDLGSYSNANLHRALHIKPDGTMNCKCHGPGRLVLNGETLIWQASR